MLPANVTRTLAMLHRLAAGGRLSLPDGVLAMGDNMAIGYAIPDDAGGWHISRLSTLTLEELDALLTEHSIGHPFSQKGHA